MFCNYNKNILKPFFVIDDAFLTTFYQHVQFLFVHHMDKIEHIYLILKFFVPVDSFFGVEGSPSWFNKCMICISGNM